MLTISDSQMNQLLDITIDKYIVKANENLIAENITNYTIPQLKKIIKDALGANIKKESQVYQYIKIVINEPQLQEIHKPDWLKNILYIDVNAESKLTAIRRHLNL